MYGITGLSKVLASVQGRCTRGWSAAGLAACSASKGPDGAYQVLGRLGGDQSDVSGAQVLNVRMVCSLAEMGSYERPASVRRPVV